MNLKPAQTLRPKRRHLNLALLERGRHHLIVRQTVYEDGMPKKRPVLWIIIPGADGLLRIFRYEPLLEYYADHSAMSYTWMKNAARAVGALFDHSLAVGASPSFDQWREQGGLQRRLVRGLARSLAHGTMEIGPDGRTVDPTRLYWSPRGKRQAAVLLSALTLHFRWFQNEPSAAKWAQATSTDAIAKSPRVALSLATELMIRRHNSLLGHLKGLEREPAHAFPGVIEPSRRGTGAVPTFPAKYVGPFLYEGFKDESGECDEAGQLLAHFAIALGLRKSEGFHLYNSDVQFIGDVPWIFFHHPEFGKIADGGRYVTREEYLERFGLLPRNRDTGRNKAGWKGMADDEQGTPGYFLPIPSLRHRVAQLLTKYLYVTRPAIMARRPRHLPDHPFLFVSRGRTLASGGGDIGDPYTMTAFEHSWGQGIKRVGLQFDDPTMMTPIKWRGTTQHGGRHFYGRFLFTSGVPGDLIQRCMHHRTLKAHLAYTQLTPSEINTLLNDASGDCSPDQSFRNMRDEFASQFRDPQRQEFHRQYT
ncbi:hypothetical protein [Mesorhizobium sp.]|uniref:hypothetical protein n=1 Tax=Mesorhizobium sp. TaxID=1871066 RepID=UPI0025DCDF00|nr:hypothetical protein [Mesorhizobium sp.]